MWVHKIVESDLHGIAMYGVVAPVLAMSRTCPRHVLNVLFLGKDITFNGTQDTKISVMPRVLMAGS